MLLQEGSVSAGPSCMRSTGVCQLVIESQQYQPPRSTFMPQRPAVALGELWRAWQRRSSIIRNLLILPINLAIPIRDCDIDVGHGGGM